MLRWIGAVKRKVTVAGPDHILALMPEIAFMRASGPKPLIPGDHPTPLPASDLDGIGERRQLAPVGKDHRIATRLHL